MTAVKTPEQVTQDFAYASQGVVGYTRQTLSTLSPTARLGWLAKALADLGLDTGFLSGAHDLAARAQSMQRVIFEAHQRAQAERAEAVGRLAAYPKPSLDEAAAVAVRVSAWLDQSGQAPAVAMCREAARLIEGQIDAQVMMSGERIFAMLQGKVRAIVAEVAALPALPADVWRSPAPEQDLVRHREHRPTWGTLTAATADFNSAHLVADQFRDFIGAGSNSLPDGAPALVLSFRNWRPVLDDQQLNMIKKPLRLRYAIEQGYEPGLWRPDDVKTRPEDATFAGRMRNLGQAVRGSAA